MYERALFPAHGLAVAIQRRGLRCAGVLGVAAALLIVTACGSGSSGDEQQTHSTAAHATTAANGSPIKIGFHNTEGGAVSFPELRTGWEAGIKYINEHLGGVDGHPLETVSCAVDGTPESSINCANKFVEQHVVAAAQGIDGSADAMTPILSGAGIADIGSTAYAAGQAADVSGKSFFFSNPVEAYSVAALVALKNAGAKKVRLFLADVPGARESAKYLEEEAAPRLGMDAKIIFYSSANADWASLVATAMAAHPDAIGAFAAPDPDCTGMMTAMVRDGFKGPVFAGACSAFVKALGASAVQGTLTYSDLYPATAAVIAAAPAAKAKELRTYLDAMQAAGEDKAATGTFPQVGFGLAMDIYGAFSQIAKSGEGLSAKTVASGMRTVSGQRFMGAPYDCSKAVWPKRNGCSIGVLVLKSRPDGDRVPLGGFLNLSAYVPAS